jgi:hypothetical protein
MCYGTFYFKLKIVLLHSTLDAGAISNFYQIMEPHKNSAAPQHWLLQHFWFTTQELLIFLVLVVYKSRNADLLYNAHAICHIISM